MKKTAIYLTFLILSFLIFASPSVASKDLQLSTLFFPQTDSWTPLGQMPNPDMVFFESIEPKLKNALAKAKFHGQFEDTSNSFSRHLFSEVQSSLSNFYIWDLDGNGSKDIFYSGRSYGSEGDITIFWFKEKDGFIVRQNKPLYIKVLRVENKTLNLSSVEVGCCDSRIDTYYKGHFKNIRRDGERRITKSTEVIIDKTPTPFFKAKNKLVLRKSPRIDDAYDRDTSEWVDAAVFGNILTKYLPGCSGRIAGQTKDDYLRQWSFVLIGMDCNPLRFHSPFQVNAGWVLSNDILIKEDIAPRH